MDDWLCLKPNLVNLLENTDFLADDHLINLRVSQMESVSIALLMRRAGSVQDSKTTR
jgi:hypothetical protein